MKMSMQEAIARQENARVAYGRAVKEFRAAFAELRALDVLLQSRDHRGFGEFPPVVMLRHAIAAPDESGSLDQDAGKIFATLQIEG